MDSLRLLVHETCNRYCELCCNQSPLHDLDDLPVCEDFTPYKEVILTGGEPMLDPLTVSTIIWQVRTVNPQAKVYMYTAKSTPPANLLLTLSELDGLTLTLHEQKDVPAFQKLQLWRGHYADLVKDKSLWLNYFEADVSLRHVNTVGWELRPLQWEENCPLPENEVFMRYRAPTEIERKYRAQYQRKNLGVKVL